jgi:hypothetical protein
VIFRGLAFSAFGSTNVITPSFSSTLIASCIVADIVFGINRLQSGVIREINTTFNRQHVVFYADIDAVLVHSWHFEDDC